MFTCDICLQDIGPKVKPIRVVTETRAKEYHNVYYKVDEWGNREKCEVDSQGHEIVSEMLLCPDDAAANGIEIPEGQVTSRSIGHAFEEPLPQPLRPKLIAVAVANAVDRHEQANKGYQRAKRDSEVAIPIIKWFADNNKGYLF